MPSLGTLIRGRAGVPGPLSQLGLGRDGTYYIIAAGRCSHAGVGDWQGVTSGNSRYIGIEAENRGRNDPWPSVQMMTMAALPLDEFIDRLERGGEKGKARERMGG